MLLKGILIFLAQKNNAEFAHISDRPKEIDGSEGTAEIFLNLFLSCSLVKNRLEMNRRIAIFRVNILTTVLHVERDFDTSLGNLTF
jgi:hypothetical protein